MTPKSQMKGDKIKNKMFYEIKFSFGEQKKNMSFLERSKFPWASIPAIRNIKKTLLVEIVLDAP